MEHTASATLSQDAGGGNSAAPNPDLEWLFRLPDLQLANLATSKAIGHGTCKVLVGRWEGRDVAVKCWDFYDSYSRRSDFRR